MTIVPLCHANPLQESAQLQPTVDRDWQEGSAVQQSWYLHDGEILTISDSSIRSSAQLNLDSYQIDEDLPHASGGATVLVTAAVGPGQVLVLTFKAEHLLRALSRLNCISKGVGAIIITNAPRELIAVVCKLKLLFP